MGSLSRLIKEKGGQFEGVKTEQVRVQQIHYTKLKESRMNFYTRNEEEVEELADTMIIAGGILQPLIVRKTDLREYEILVQHCLLPPPCPDTNIRHCFSLLFRQRCTSTALRKYQALFFTVI